MGVEGDGDAKEEEELRTESRVLTRIFVSQGQVVAVSSLRCYPSESTGELIPPSFAEMKQTSDLNSNCRATDRLSDDSDAAFSTSHGSQVVML